jgi:hypothetical protein
LSDRKRTHYGLLRLKGFFNVLLKNRMALTGILMLSFFVLLGVAAPSLTPYRPQGDIVSGARDAPAWVTLFNGQTGYSQNIEFSDLSVRGAGLSVTSKGPDSVVLNVTSATGGTMRLLETLAYPYDGPPARFLGDVSITPQLPAGAAAFVNMSIVRYVNGLACRRWTGCSQHNQHLYSIPRNRFLRPRPEAESGIRNKCP